MVERFTDEARKVVVLAQEFARLHRHAHIGTEHLLLAVLAQRGSPVTTALEGLGVTQETAEAAVLEVVPRGAKESAGHIPFTPRAKEVMELSLRASLDRGDRKIRPEHLLLGILAEGEGVAAKVLSGGGRTLEQVRAAVVEAVGPGGGGAGPGMLGARRTPAAEKALALAEKLAAGAPVGSHHLLEALAAVDSGMAGRALAALDITSDALTVQIDAIDLTDTTDATPEQAAAATMTLSIDAGTLTLTSTDPKLVERLAGLVEQADGPLTGNGVLSGPFVALHRAVATAIASIDLALNPPPAPPESGEAALPRLLGRLRRGRRAS